MRVLVLGSGAREHTIAWMFSRSNRISGLYAAPGNAGTETICDNVGALDPEDSQGVIRFAGEHRIDLVFVGPEAPLEAGVVDALDQAGIAVIGPHRKAAQLETSKEFSKQFMLRHSVPTADAQSFDSVEAFERYVRGRSGKMVVKKSGLAAGKGVLESDDTPRILDFGSKILKSDSVLVEEFLSGWEVSMFALSDGTNYRILPACADFKKAKEGDLGDNTGGMGAICPVPLVSDDLEEKIRETIIEPTFEGMRDEGLMYRGVLFFGLMITESGPQLLEYNVRFGDPESQVLLPLIRSDFVNLCESITDGGIDSFPLRISPNYAVGVVVAANGYPASYRKGIAVKSLPSDVNGQLNIFHASTDRDENGIIRTGGGRCFTVVGVGPTILSANQRAYAAVSGVNFSGAWYRNDIGQKFVIGSE